jgi:glycerate dehydrogenase
MKIVILDGYAANPGDISYDELNNLGSLTVYPRTDESEVVERAKDADIILTNKVAFNAQLFDELPNLKLICVQATGYNTIDLEAASKHGVVVCNVPAYSTMSVAQMTFAHIFNIFNRVEHYSVLNREGRWSENLDFCYWDTNLREVYGMTLGIVGLGNIGMQVAKIACDFGMKVIASTSKDAASLPEGIEKKSLDELLAESDIITLHCPLNADTKEMICEESIAKMKKGAVIINTGRGGLINEEDVADALSCGILSAYGADTMTMEPPRKDNPLLKCENAFFTPHIAWATLEARTRLYRQVVKNVEAFINGSPINKVN